MDLSERKHATDVEAFFLPQKKTLIFSPLTLMSKQILFIYFIMHDSGRKGDMMRIYPPQHNIAVIYKKIVKLIVVVN